MDEKGVAGAEAQGRGVGLLKPLMKAGEAGGAAEWLGVVLGRRCEGGKCGKTGGEDKVTYCPQREPEEGHKERRPVPARYAVHQEAALI